MDNSNEPLDFSSYPGEPARTQLNLYHLYTRFYLDDIFELRESLRNFGIDLIADANYIDMNGEHAPHYHLLFFATHSKRARLYRIMRPYVKGLYHIKHILTQGHMQNVIDYVSTHPGACFLGHDSFNPEFPPTSIQSSS